jgi:hypothetical protein
MRWIVGILLVVVLLVLTAPATASAPSRSGSERVIGPYSAPATTTRQ